MNDRVSRRGQPVVALLLVVIGWCALRTALWETPFPVPLAAAVRSATRLIAPILHKTPDAPLRPALPTKPLAPPVRPPREPLWLEPRYGSPPAVDEGAPEPPGMALATDPAPGFARVSPRVAGGHVLLLAAAFAQLQVPPGLAALVLRAHARPAPVPAFPLLVGDSARTPGKRWSGDAWLLVRQDTATPITSGRGSYGQSQVGAVLRYRIAPSSGHRPAAYVRVSSPLASAGEVEVAGGLAARPVPGVPVALAAEVRAAHFDTGTAARPAVFAYSEFPRLELPLGVRGEAYVQGGYVGGRFATPFVDGQVRVDRHLARLGHAELRAGGGAWGGAQKGAQRLDVGPGATFAVEVGGAPLRMSADWRFRVAGEANPSSGPALTVSTGF
ncbi:MAG TPA: hypothetical protein VL100_02795 [Croceibacterium sp.]|nr:hypothetical protein [Croceibacterium sp.]